MRRKRGIGEGTRDLMQQGKRAPPLKGVTVLDLSQWRAIRRRPRVKPERAESGRLQTDPRPRVVVFAAELLPRATEVAEITGGPYGATTLAGSDASGEPS